MKSRIIEPIVEFAKEHPVAAGICAAVAGALYILSGAGNQEYCRQFIIPVEIFGQSAKGLVFRMSFPKLSDSEIFFRNRRPAQSAATSRGRRQLRPRNRRQKSRLANGSSYAEQKVSYAVGHGICELRIEETSYKYPPPLREVLRNMRTFCNVCNSQRQDLIFPKTVKHVA